MEWQVNPRLFWEKIDFAGDTLPVVAFEEGCFAPVKILICNELVCRRTRVTVSVICLRQQSGDMEVIDVGSKTIGADLQLA